MSEVQLGFTTAWATVYFDAAALHNAHVSVLALNATGICHCRRQGVPDRGIS